MMMQHFYSYLNRKSFVNNYIFQYGKHPVPTSSSCSSSPCSYSCSSSSCSSSSSYSCYSSCSSSFSDESVTPQNFRFLLITLLCSKNLSRSDDSETLLKYLNFFRRHTKCHYGVGLELFQSLIRKVIITSVRIRSKMEKITIRA